MHSTLTFCSKQLCCNKEQDLSLCVVFIEKKLTIVYNCLNRHTSTKIACVCRGESSCYKLVRS